MKFINILTGLLLSDNKFIPHERHTNLEVIRNPNNKARNMKYYFNDDFGFDINSLGKISSSPQLNISSPSKKFLEVSKPRGKSGPESEPESESKQKLRKVYHTTLNLKYKFETGSFWMANGKDMYSTFDVDRHDPKVQNQLLHLKKIATKFNLKAGSHKTFKSASPLSKNSLYNYGLDERFDYNDNSSFPVNFPTKPPQKTIRDTEDFAQLNITIIRESISSGPSEVESNSNNITESINNIYDYDTWLGGSTKLSGNISEELAEGNITTNG